MKNRLFQSARHQTVLLLVLAVTLTGCEKNDSNEVTPTVQGILDQYLDQDFDGYYMPNTESEQGYIFTPLTNGHITHLGAKAASAGEFEIRVYNITGTWNQYTQVIGYKNLEVTVANDKTYAPIGELFIEKDNTYAITMRYSEYILFNRGELNFPYQTDSISITGYAGVHHTSPPNYLRNQNASEETVAYIQGIPDFVFVPGEED